MNAICTFAFQCILQYGNDFALGALYVWTVSTRSFQFRNTTTSEIGDEENQCPANNSSFFASVCVSQMKRKNRYARNILIIVCNVVWFDCMRYVHALVPVPVISVRKNVANHGKHIRLFDMEIHFRYDKCVRELNTWLRANKYFDV